jgi:hypothetical protein
LSITFPTSHQVLRVVAGLTVSALVAVGAIVALASSFLPFC